MRALSWTRTLTGVVANRRASPSEKSRNKHSLDTAAFITLFLNCDPKPWHTKWTTYQISDEQYERLTERALAAGYANVPALLEALSSEPIDDLHGSLTNDELRKKRCLS